MCLNNGALKKFFSNFELNLYIAIKHTRNEILAVVT